ncbi:MmgE/PrpD family protein [Halobellus captivus]|uniref:MmgE/PrpD family protein n=1 Tax=Halobellus captivus TaxID=2592614 RepID=UPI001396856E|nr:MmgE/PrpD family protein [Halobellus captivus]
MSTSNSSANDDLVDALCSFATELSYEDIPPETIETAKLRLFDSVAVGLMALKEEPVQRLVSHAATKSSTENASILGTDQTASLEYAAFSNAGMIRYLDWNDTYLTAEAAHPSGNVGAILAAGEVNESNGRDILLATVLAYEIQCRLCDLASFTGNGFDHVNYGLASIPLAVGKLMNLSKKQLKEAVSISLTGHLGLLQARQAPLSEWKSFAFGNVARNGVVAAELAQSGIRGPSQVFTGTYGIDSVVDPGLNPADLALSDGFLIDKTHLKRYPICHHILAGIDCVTDIVEETGLDPTDIRSIDVDTYDIAIRATAGSGRWRPTTRGTADHSLPYCLARTLIDGTIGPDELDESRLEEDDVVALMDTIEVHHDESFTERYGDTFSHRVTIETTTDEVEHRVDYPQGHFKNPLKTQDVADKVLNHSHCSPTAVDDLRTAIEEIDSATDISDVLRSAARIGQQI